MTRTPGRRVFVVVLALGLMTASASVSSARQANAEALYLDARRLFEALEYESAIKALDEAILALESSAPLDSARRDRLANAYEMRARSRFGLGNPEEARTDFVALLRFNPNYTLTGQVSPRVVTLFEETVAATLATLNLNVTPATAKITLDDVSMPATGSVRVPAGDHVLTVEQRGYRTVRQPITAKAGEATEVAVPLERISSVIHVLTVPPDVDVALDGTKVGKTAAGPPSSEYRDLVSKAGAGAGNVSAALVLADITPGTHTLELSHDCTVRVSNQLAIEKPDDVYVGPVVMQPAVANLSVQANEPGAQVYIDGRQLGVVPFTTAELCEGAHLVEVRSKFGRDSRRLDVRAGDKIVVDGVIKPALAIVSASSESGATDPDLRLSVERAFSGAKGVTLLALPVDQIDRALKASQLPANWLAMDAEARPLGAAAQIGKTVRSDASSKLSEMFGTQGVASVTALDRNRVVVSILAPGSGMPDVLDVRLDRPESIAAAVERIDRTMPLVRPVIGLLAVDVADVAGAVVAGVDANSPAAAAKVQAGDVIVSVDGQPVADAAALSKLVAARHDGDTMPLELHDASGTAKRAELKVFLTPLLMGLSDRAVLANRALLDLRARLAATNDPFQQSVIRLNTAVALIRVGECNAARVELKQVQLPDRPGVGGGTVQYLLGVCAEEQGNRAEADTAFTAAAATDSLLTEDGPPVKELVPAARAQ